MSDFVIRYIIMLFSASAILAVSVILLMLSVPLTGEWKNFRTVRLCLAFTCLVLSASDFVSCFAMDSNQEAQLFSTLTLIVASYQAMLFTTRSSPQRADAAGRHYCRRSFPPCVAIPFSPSVRVPVCSGHSGLHRANRLLHPCIPQGLHVVRGAS